MLVQECRVNAGRNGLGRPGEVVATWVRRGGALACALGLALGAAGAWAQGAAAAPAERLALGLIVKLKDTQVNSVVRLPASVRPSDTAQAQRLRMAAATNRKRVGFLVQKPTAYGAHVIHQGHYTTVAEAEAEAAKLRQDPDVEWVVVNRMERAAATGVQFGITTTAGNAAYLTHKWLQRRADVGLGVAGFRDAWDRLNNASKPGSIPSPLDLSPVVVAVLDTGKLTHPDLDARTPFGFGYDFVSEVQFAQDGNGLDPDPTDPGDYLVSDYSSTCTAHDSSWHGTSVMSMLTPLADDPATLMGPGALSMLPPSVAKVLPVRIGGTCGALVSDIIEGMLWAAGVDYQGSPGINQAPARVINLSFGGQGNCQNTDPKSGDALYRQTIATLRTKGTLVVSSAGNGDSSDTARGYVGPTRPASCPGVMAVTALRYDGSKATYANTVDGTRSSAGYFGLAVAGGDSISASSAESLNLLSDRGPRGAVGVALEGDICDNLGRCYVSMGTSFAAPQVAAVAALVLSVAPTLTVDQLVSVLLETATPHPAPSASSCNLAAQTVGNCTCTTAACGSGVLDADAALDRAIRDHASSGTFSSPSLYASYFVPQRLQSAGKSGGGGGGATDDLSLLALMASVLGLTWWRWRSEAQARAMRTVRTVRIRGDRLKGGKR